jgi:HD-GYP domain-containing protein (c-di-GMP phosphodiesterase class II)
MDSRFIDPTEPFTEADLWEYQKHPLITIKCLGKDKNLSAGIDAAITQLHEQYDGSGYPRGMTTRRIHLYARILNVVDTYLQLTNPAYSRPSIVAHDALGVILHQATLGRFDPNVVRAFLTTETLFPIGSTVELDSGEIARVIRRPRNGYAMPVLESTDGGRIELETGSIEVIRPALDPKCEQMRLTPDLMLAGCDSSGVPLLPY